MLPRNRRRCDQENAVAVRQRWLPAGEQPSWRMRTAMMETVSLCVRDGKLNAFVDLESVIRAASDWLGAPYSTRKRLSAISSLR
jgi:hypothetical protein